MAKLNLDRDKVDRCRDLAERLVHPVQKYIHLHSSIAIERATLRLLGIEENWVNKEAHTTTPLVNALVDQLEKRKLSLGIATWLAAAKAKNPRLSPNKLVARILEGRTNLNQLQEPSQEEARKILQNWINDSMKRLDQSRKNREKMRSKLGRGRFPLNGVLLGEETLDQNLELAQFAADNGVDIVFVKRGSGQSLFDFIPHKDMAGAESYATPHNIAVVRESLNDYSYKIKRYIRLGCDASGLCMPELSAIGALGEVDYMTSDSLYGPLLRDLNMKRHFIDQYFSRLIMGRTGMIIQTQEDQLLNTGEAYHHQSMALASHFINEQFAKQAGVREEQMGLTHAFEMNPQTEDFFVYELAMAQLLRDVFTRHPLIYMPPTFYKNGQAAVGQMLNAFHQIVGMGANQSVQILGSTVADIRQRSKASLQNTLSQSQFLASAVRSLSDELHYNTNGKLVRRSRTILDNALKSLEKIHDSGLMESLERGLFGYPARHRDAGRGYEGIFQKSRKYFNPFFERLNVGRN